MIISIFSNSVFGICFPVPTYLRILMRFFSLHAASFSSPPTNVMYLSPLPLSSAPFLLFEPGHPSIYLICRPVALLFCRGYHSVNLVLPSVRFYSCNVPVCYQFYILAKLSCSPDLFICQ